MAEQGRWTRAFGLGHTDARPTPSPAAWESGHPPTGGVAVVEQLLQVGVVDDAALAPDEQAGVVAVHGQGRNALPSPVT